MTEVVSGVTDASLNKAEEEIKTQKNEEESQTELEHKYVFWVTMRAQQ